MQLIRLSVTAAGSDGAQATDESANDDLFHH